MKCIAGLLGIVLLLTLAIGPSWAPAQEKIPVPQQNKDEDQPEVKIDRPAGATTATIDSGDTAWVLISTALVMFMVPGLALFYGGMVRRKNILGTMMHSMIALSLIGLQWVLFGYCLAFGTSQGGRFGWNLDLIGLQGVEPNAVYPGTHIPVFVHCMFQGMFAIITPALISGALAEPVRFGPYCLFILLWATLVYDPLAHWVWAVNKLGVPVGWLAAQGALDFAGGTVVHISAGFSALAAILLLPKRRGYPEHAMHPSSMVLTLLGAGLLWFGWFGFNGGSALASGGAAAVPLVSTQVAAAAAAFSWLICEWLHRGNPTALGVGSGLVAGLVAVTEASGIELPVWALSIGFYIGLIAGGIFICEWLNRGKPTALGFGSGLVAGLVAVTPASGYVTPLSALYIGLIAGGICYTAVSFKPLLKYDDSLDAFGIHGIGGVVGTLLTGVFAANAFFNIANDKPKTDFLGALSDGQMAQVTAQFIATTVAVLYSFLVTLVLVFVIDKLWGFSLDEKAESEGVDRSEHGETGFDLGAGLEMAPAAAPRREPTSATEPPNGKRHFTVVVDGANPRDLMGVWSNMCGNNSQPPSLEFRSVYQFVTTVQGNRFNFRGGDPILMREAMQRLFSNSLEGTPIRTHIEN